MFVTTEISKGLGRKRPRCSVCGSFIGAGGNIGKENYCKKCAENLVIELNYPWVTCPLCEGTGNYLGGMCNYCVGLGYHEMKG